MKRKIAYVLGIAMLMAAGSMAADTPPTKNKLPDDALLVEILVFSGRPNPVFLIQDPSEIRQVVAMLKGLPKHPRLSGNSSVLPSALGYRGIAVENLSTTALDLEAFTVSRSDVQMRNRKVGSSQEATTQFLLDSSMQLEDKLLEIGQLHGAIDDNLLRVIKAAKSP